MYEPPAFRDDDLDVQHALIQNFPLGLLVSSGPAGPVANAVPFLLDRDRGPRGTLRAHMARANGQFATLSGGQPVLVIFQGTDAYVTPSWYASKREHGKVVPTWNYAMVQVRGVAKVIEDQAWLGQQVRDLTSFHESKREQPWHVEDAPAPFIASQLRGIAGLEIEIETISGKWKVSQNRPEADRIGVAAGLENPAMAELVRRYGKLSDSP